MKKGLHFYLALDQVNYVPFAGFSTAHLTQASGLPGKVKIKKKWKKQERKVIMFKSWGRSQEVGAAGEQSAHKVF